MKKKLIAIGLICSALSIYAADTSQGANAGICPAYSDSDTQNSDQTGFQFQTLQFRPQKEYKGLGDFYFFHQSAERSAGFTADEHQFFYWIAYNILKLNCDVTCYKGTQVLINKEKLCQHDKENGRTGYRNCRFCEYSLDDFKAHMKGAGFKHIENETLGASGWKALEALTLNAQVNEQKDDAALGDDE